MTENETKLQSMEVINGLVEMCAKSLNLKEPYQIIAEAVFTILRILGKDSTDDAFIAQKKFAKMLHTELGITASEVNSLSSMENGACACALNSVEDKKSKSTVTTYLKAPEKLWDDPKHSDNETDETFRKAKELSEEPTVECVDETKINPMFRQQSAELKAEDDRETVQEVNTTESKTCNQKVQTDEEPEKVESAVQTEVAAHHAQTDQIELNAEVKEDGNEVTEILNNRTTTTSSTNSGLLESDDLYTCSTSSHDTSGGARPKNTFFHLLKEDSENTQPPTTENTSNPTNITLGINTSEGQAQSLIRRNGASRSSSEERVPHEPKKIHELTAQRKVEVEAASKLQSGNSFTEETNNKHLARLSKPGNSAKHEDEFSYDPQERAQSVPEEATYHQISEQRLRSMDDAMYSPRTGRRPLQSLNRPYYLEMDPFRNVPNKRLHQNNPSMHHQSLPYLGNLEPSKSHTNSDISSSPRSKFNFRGQSSPVMVQSPPEGAEVISKPLTNQRTADASVGNAPSPMEALIEEQTPSAATSSVPSTYSVLPSSSSGIETSRLVTDHSCSTIKTPDVLQGASNEPDLSPSECTLPSSGSNLTPSDEPNVPSIPKFGATNVNDLETDGSFVHDDVTETVTLDNIQSCDIVPEPEPIENIPEPQPEPIEIVAEEPTDLVTSEELNNSTESNDSTEDQTRPDVSNQNDLEGSRPCARSEPSPEPSSRHSRRVLRAQRRNRQRRTHSNQPPEVAAAAIARTAARNTGTASNDQNKKEMLQRFGIDDDEAVENIDPEEIRKENQRLKNARLCQVCKDKDSNRLFLPCAHLSSCSLCSPALTKCPQCRSAIRGIVSVYFG